MNVLFNSLFLTHEQLAAADAAGTLDEIAAPYGEVAASYQQLIDEDQAKAGTGKAAPAVPGAMPTPPPASVQNKLATARIDSLEPSSPTSGPAPGQGRILNSLRKVVV